MRADVRKGPEMDWKSFVKGLIAGIVLACLLLVGAARFLRWWSQMDAEIACEFAIDRVESSLGFSRMSEKEIQACLEANIEIPEGE